MKLPATVQGPEKNDYWVALVVAALALAVYVRTLAPDILYGDSAEFQTQAYTFGITHSTGYPTYLLLGRLLGFLPIRSPAWRISLLSAVGAALTLSGVYLLSRYFTRSRVGAVLGSMALGISYTFWSQAVIAEVYTTGLAFLTGIMLLLFHWQSEPVARNLSLCAAALLAGIGFGVHSSVWLVAPPAIAFVLWTLWMRGAARSEWLRSLSSGLIGAVAGLAIFLTAFLISDALNPPTSFIRTTLVPSRTIWNLQAEDFDSPFERMKMTVFSVQWGDALFPGGGFSFVKEIEHFLDRLVTIEFSPPLLLFVLIGLAVMLITQPLRGAFYPVHFLLTAVLFLNYQVDDKNIFYLSLYIPMTIAAGVGMGFVLDWVHRYLEPLSGWGYRLLYLLPILFFATTVIQPSAAVRWKALRDGAASFVTEEYPFPVKNLKEPRIVAQTHLAGAADNAVFVLDWRGLFATAYLARVEKGMTDTLFFEAMPRGNDGKVAASLIAELKEKLHEGRPVFVDQRYPGLDEEFRLVPVAGNLYELSLRSQ